jgi:UPF0755 protein
MTKRLPHIFLALLILLCLGVLILQIKLNRRVPVKAQDGAGIVYEVPSGISLIKLARDLESKGIINSGFLFRWYLQLSGKDREIKSGFYELPPSVSIKELGHTFTRGLTASRRITIPEGHTSWEIFSILKQHYTLDSMVFDSLVHNRELAASYGIKDYSIEGYLYPETYQMPYELTEEKALKIMVNQFLEEFTKLDLRGSPVMKKYGMHGLITLASIVEAEAAVKSEQKLISGVFYNRLQKDWPLGADPTIRFVLKKMEGPLRVSELKNPSPYNTRIYIGLPPGPICSPGKDAILAAAFPEKTEHLYFVAKDDGSRGHFFSKTGRQHTVFKEERKKNQALNQ